MSSLNSRQQAFCEAYLETWNATRAADTAGYANPGQSGHRLLKNDEIAAEISRRLDELAMPANEVVARLGEHAKGDMGAFFKLAEEWTQWPLPSYEIIDAQMRPDPDDDEAPEVTFYLVRHVTIDLERVMSPRYSRLIKKFSDSPKNGLTLELHDAQAALKLLGQTHGIFKEKVELSGRVDTEAVVTIYMPDNGRQASDGD